jgi:hypothetical protein
MDKHTSLLRKFVNYGRNFFLHWAQAACKTWGLFNAFLHILLFMLPLGLKCLPVFYVTRGQCYEKNLF